MAKSVLMCHSFLLIGVILFGAINSHAFSIESACPRIFKPIFDNSAPIGNKGAGNFTEISGSTNLFSCVVECCKLQDKCNVAFVHNNTCYHVNCHTNELCLPLKRPNITSSLQMVLVNPVNDDSWMDVIKNTPLKADFLVDNNRDMNGDRRNYFDTKFDPSDAAYSAYFDDLNGPQTSSIGLKRINNRYYDPDNNIGYERFSSDQYTNDENDMQVDESKFYTDRLSSCEYGIDSICPSNEECIQLNLKSRNGICNCRKGYYRSVNGNCEQQQLSDENDMAKVIAQKLLMKNSNAFGSEMEQPKSQETSDPKPLKHLTVSVVSKTLEPPEMETTLSAYTVPDEKSSGDKYSYVWTLISKPNGAVNGTMRDQGKDEVKLSNLSEGLYQFKVTVTGNGSSGEAFANVTVSPKKRINQTPIVNITPKEQTVKLPNSKAILDGSTSKDDDDIISWHWELMQGPIGYQPILPDINTLQLSDLTLPGNYTFKLTVTDSDKAQNSTTATITVLKVIDYPPEANAGPNVIVYLPHNNVTLNGSLSTDDREIVAWEWTKDSNDQSKAVDMQNTRTQFLKLSNLEEGIYTFVLKVMDASNQTSTSTVRVFVKQPTNLPPTVNAGKNMTINLPQNYMILNGSESTDTNGISGYHWTQISGPASSIIANANASIANATSLTIGDYVFELTVSNANNMNASNRVYVTVIQERNTPPVANAGGDLTVSLPLSVITLDGSKSSDDLGIVNYTWTREGGSLAIGDVIGYTNKEAKLMITNVQAGRYIFRLTVADAQGTTSSDTASIIVHPDPLIMNLVELTLTMEARLLTESELESLEQKLTLLLGDNTKLYVRNVRVEEKTKEAVIIFYVERMLQDGKQVLLAGQEVETILREKFWRDASILGASISDIRTTVCQNTCSGHGVCNSETRACLCETFWMPDIFYFWGVSEANCDWSILYVIIGVFIGFLFLSGVCWGITCLCRRSYKPRGRSKPQKYALLGTHEEEVSHTKSPFSRGNTLSDSETDSDVLFESRTKPNGILRSSNNGEVRNNNGHKYSVTRLGRRIKT